MHAIRARPPWRQWLQGVIGLTALLASSVGRSRGQGLAIEHLERRFFGVMERLVVSKPLR